MVTFGSFCDILGLDSILNNLCTDSLLLSSDKLGQMALLPCPVCIYPLSGEGEAATGGWRGGAWGLVLSPPKASHLEDTQKMINDKAKLKNKKKNN